MGTAACGDANPLALPPLSRSALRDYLSWSVFHVTAVHELLGNILLDVSVPTTVSTRIRPMSFFDGTGADGVVRPPQATVTRPRDAQRGVAAAAGRQLRGGQGDQRIRPRARGARC